MRHQNFLMIAGLSLILSACLEGVHSGPLCLAESAEAEANQNCQLVEQSFFVNDSFERADLIGSDPGGFNFGWRAIIDDMGRVIDSSSGNNVEVRIYDDQTLGPASTGNGAMYFRGRAGSSVHNIYLISETYDLSSFDDGALQFDYLPIDLEPGEYIRIEVCNDTLENCGVGDSLDLNGLNDNSKWTSLFEAGPESDGNGLNGFNHSLGDWQRVRLDFFLESFPKSTFTFRFNVRMDEGFIGNDINNGMEDGLGIDNVLGATSAGGLNIAL